MPNRVIFRSDADRGRTSTSSLDSFGGQMYTLDGPTGTGLYGGSVNIGVPTFPANAVLQGAGYLVSGTLTVEMSSDTWIPLVDMWDSNNAALINFFPNDGSDLTNAPWIARMGYTRYSPCPYTGTLINGMEVFVDRGVPVCSANYGLGQQGVGPPYTADNTHTYTYHDETQTGGLYANFANFFTWFGARQGTTVSLNMWTNFAGVISGPFGSGSQSANPQIVNRLGGIRLIVIFDFLDVTAPSWVGPHVIGDTFNNVTALVWVGAGSGGNKPLYVGIHRGLQKNVGTGSGSTAGWEVYHLMDIAAGSDWGMSILPSGRMEVMYDTIGTNGAATAMYRYSDNWGLGAAANWSVAAQLTPNRSQAVSIGRAQKQAWRFTVTG